MMASTAANWSNTITDQLKSLRLNDLLFFFIASKSCPGVLLPDSATRCIRSTVPLFVALSIPYPETGTLMFNAHSQGRDHVSTSRLAGKSVKAVVRLISTSSTRAFPSLPHRRRPPCCPRVPSGGTGYGIAGRTTSWNEDSPNAVVLSTVFLGCAVHRSC